MPNVRSFSRTPLATVIASLLPESASGSTAPCQIKAWLDRLFSLVFIERCTTPSLGLSPYCIVSIHSFPKAWSLTSWNPRFSVARFPNFLSKSRLQYLTITPGLAALLPNVILPVHYLVSSRNYRPYAPRAPCHLNRQTGHRVPPHVQPFSSSPSKPHSHNPTSTFLSLHLRSNFHLPIPHNHLPLYVVRLPLLHIHCTASGPRPNPNRTFRWPPTSYRSVQQTWPPNQP